MSTQYLPWRFAWHFEKAYYGNRALGVEVNRHPRFREYIINLWFWSFGPTWHRTTDRNYFGIAVTKSKPLGDGTHSVEIEIR